eukprot:scaffold18389_cov110-Isochrysis_galbana.AAC.1
MDLLGDLLGDSAPAPAPAPSFGAPRAAAPPAGGMDLLDLLGGGPPSAAPSAPPVDAMAMMGLGAPTGSFAPFTAYNKNGLLITFACSKDPSNPSVTTIESSFTSSLPTPIEGLNFQVAVPKFMRLQMTPASSTVVPPNNSGKVTQVFKVANSMHGQKPVVLKIKIDYSSGGMPVTEMGQVDNFPAAGGSGPVHLAWHRRGPRSRSRVARPGAARAAGREVASWGELPAACASSALYPSRSDHGSQWFDAAAHRCEGAGRAQILCS